MARLRSPGGCPWDREQTPESLKPMLVEEAFEALQALDSGDPEDLREELGDLLLQIVFHARIAEEKGDFDMQGVIDAICDKLVNRHPHVFGGAVVRDSREVLENWNRIKSAEKSHKKRDGESLLDCVAPSTPALYEAYQLGARAARAGFDWKVPGDVLEKIREEAEELILEIDAMADDAIKDEAGDLLFAVVNLCRKLQIDPETSLKRTNRKFRDRFRHIESRVRETGRGVDECGLDELEAYWQESKTCRSSM